MSSSNSDSKERSLDRQSSEEHDPFVENPYLRMLGFAGRIGRLVGVGMAKNVRYLAYTSDVGEAFRPVAHPNIVRLGYAVSIAYVLGDISFTVKRAMDLKENHIRAGAHAALFQLFGSLVLPAVIVHTVVHQSEHVFRRFAVQGSKTMRWGPVGMGLAIVPFMPFIADEPVEYVVDEAFHRFWPVPEGEKKKHHE